MKRELVLVKDMTGTVKARMVLEEHETPVLEPWMVYNIIHFGWSVDRWKAGETSVRVDGVADWKGVAEKMADVLRRFLDENVDDEESAEEIMVSAREALDEYTLAEMEFVSIVPDTEQDKQEGGDEGGSPART